jgi:hypothetical protein
LYSRSLIKKARESLSRSYSSKQHTHTHVYERERDQSDPFTWQGINES